MMLWHRKYHRFTFYNRRTGTGNVLPCPCPCPENGFKKHLFRLFTSDLETRDPRAPCLGLASAGFTLVFQRTWWSNRRWRGRPEGKPLTRIFWLRHPDTLAIPWPMAVFWFMTYTGPSSSTSLSSSSCQCCHTIAVPLYFIVIYTVLQWHLFEILLQLSPAAAEWWYGMVRHKQNKTFPASR